jgi:hypothetical protein
MLVILDDKDLVSAMKDEITYIVDNKTWNLVVLLKENKMIRTKWVFQIKRHENGTRPIQSTSCGNNYGQQKGIINYNETFAPTSRMSIVRCVVTLAAHFGKRIHQLDIKSTFLNGDLHKEVYVSTLRI